MLDKKGNNNKFNLLEYFYYRATLFYAKREKGLGIGDNKNTAAFYVGFCISLNIVSLLLNSAHLLSKQYLQVMYDNSFVIAITIFIGTVLTSLYYFANKKSDVIFRKYEDENKIQKINRGYIIMAYILITFGLIVIVPLLR